MITEADESATSKGRALKNLEYQVLQGETMGVIQMYEDAALRAGATVAEAEEVQYLARLARERSEAERRNGR